MSNKKDGNAVEENEQDPDSGDFDFYDDIPDPNSYEEGVDDQIRRAESDHRNRIGLTIVTTICYAFLILLIGSLLIFGWMTYKGDSYKVSLVIDFMKEYAGILKDGFLPIVLVALGYFFGSNNSK